MKKVKMLRGELIGLYNILLGMSETPSSKLSFFVFRNMKYLRDEYESMADAERATAPTQEYSDYFQKKIALMRSYARVDEHGNPMVNIDNDTVLCGNAVKAREYENIIAALSKKYESDIIVYESGIGELQTRKLEMIEVELLRTSYKDFGEMMDLTFDQKALVYTYFCKETLKEIENDMFGCDAETEDEIVETVDEIIENMDKEIDEYDAEFEEVDEDKNK